MAEKMKSCKIKGIRYREHPTRKKGKIPDKYYIIRYSINGKEKQEGIGWLTEGWTEQKANEILCELKQNQRTGEGPQTLAEKRELLQKKAEEENAKKQEEAIKGITFKEVFEKYINSNITDKKEYSIKNEIMYANNWIYPMMGDLPLQSIKPELLENLKKKMLEKGRSERTVEFTLGLIRHVFNFAIKRDLFNHDNPVSKIKLPRRDNKRIRFLTRDEAELLLSELGKRSHQWSDIALVSLYAGLRASEIFKLQWSDLYFDTDRIFVKDRKNFNNGMMPMHPKLKEMFLRRRERSSEGHVFQSTNGTQIQEVSDTYTRVVDSLGFNRGLDDPRQKVVFHTLRHTYASWLVMNGVDLYTVQRMMGHKEISMTQRYAHLAPDILDKAVNVLR